MLFACKLYAQTATTGNTLGISGKLSSTDFQNVNFISNNKTRSKLTNDGLWGFGNTSSLAQVHINSKKDGRNPLQVDMLDTAKFIINSNGGVSIGNTNVPPTNGLYVSGKVGIGTDAPM